MMVARNPHSGSYGHRTILSRAMQPPPPNKDRVRLDERLSGACSGLICVGYVERCSARLPNLGPALRVGPRSVQSRGSDATWRSLARG